MGGFFAELRRRHIYRVGAGYVVVAWVLTQVVEALAQIYAPPAWIPQTFVAVLAIGFPIALVVAWMIEGKAHEAVASAVRSPATTIDYMLFGAVTLVIALIGYQQIAPSINAPARQAGLDAARLAANSPGTAISVAVLPFANMSGDPDQEFFSDGMTEEITLALAKIPDLRVVARTSAFQFKDQNRDVQSIAQQLHATHIVEGSVRKAGDRVRITAQLIKAEDGTHVWAESFDRELTDIFAIQDDIGESVARSLGMQVGLVPRGRLVSERTIDPETYELYLRGVAALRARSREELDLLEQVVTRAPNFAPGWAKFSEAGREMGLFFQRRGEEEKRGPLLARAEASARKAIELDPNLSSGYQVLAAIVGQRGRFAEAMDLYRQGLTRNPEDPELLNSYSQTLRILGYLKEALEVKERLALLEPFIPLYNRQLGELLWTLGMTEAGENLLRSTRVGGGRLMFLPVALAQQGRFADALAQWQGVTGFETGDFTRPYIEAVLQVLRAAESKTSPPAQLPEFNSELSFYYAFAGAPERMLGWPENALKDGDYRPLQYLWWPLPSSVRKTDRFKMLVRNAGLVDFWRDRGWPDLCRPVGTDNFECD